MALEWRARTAVLGFSGEIDMVSASGFQEDMSSALAERPDRLVVDLTEVGFLASAGLAALAATYEQAGEHTGICVVAPQTAVSRPLQVTALDRKIPVYASREEALAAD